MQNVHILNYTIKYNTYHDNEKSFAAHYKLRALCLLTFRELSVHRGARHRESLISHITHPKIMLGTHSQNNIECNFKFCTLTSYLDNEHIFFSLAQTVNLSCGDPG